MGAVRLGSRCRLQLRANCAMSPILGEYRLSRARHTEANRHYAAPAQEALDLILDPPNSPRVHQLNNREPPKNRINPPSKIVRTLSSGRCSRRCPCAAGRLTVPFPEMPARPPHRRTETELDVFRLTSTGKYR